MLAPILPQRRLPSYRVQIRLFIPCVEAFLFRRTPKKLRGGPRTDTDVPARTFQLDLSVRIKKLLVFVDEKTL